MSELSPPAIEASPPPLSEAEVRSEINSLTAGERTKLIKIASCYAWKGRISFEEPDDLFQEAIRRVLARKRQWPRGLEKVTFLAGVIKSIAWDRKREQEQALKARKEREAGEVGQKDYEGKEARGIHAGLDVQRIRALFDDDPIAQKMLTLIAHGTKGRVLRQASGLSPTEYESKLKKIRRRIEKLKT